jgi:monoterpene epsilon-lactone hydrolase
MASKESKAMVDLYKDWTARMAKGDMDIPQLRVMFETWGGLATEPTAVEFNETEIGGVKCLIAVPKGADQSRVLLCFHGGGFVCGSANSHRKMFAHIAKAVGCKAVIVEYTRTPDNVHPGILTQCVAVYAGLLESGVKPENIATIGDSAGGNLATATLLYADLLGYPMPAASVPLSPWYDMEPTGETMKTNAELDAFVQPDAVRFLASLHLGGKSPKGPLASPLYAELKNLPPTLIQVGEHETLLDDSRRFVEKAKKAGVDIELQTFPEMQHVFQLMAGNAPEADIAIGKIAKWLRPKLHIA